MGMKSRIGNILEKYYNKKYCRTLSSCRKEISYKEYLEERKKQDKLPDQNEQPQNTEGERTILVFYRKGGELTQKAGKIIKDYFASHPRCRILFGDEQEQEHPIFRGEFGPDNFLSGETLGSVIAVDGTLAKETEGKAFIEEKLCTSGKNWCETEFSSETEILPMLIELIDKAGGFQPGRGAICHVDEVLYRGKQRGDEKQQLQKAMDQIDYPHKQKTVCMVGKKLSIVIPTKDHPEILGRCLYSLGKSPVCAGLEIIVVDNGSNRENKDKIRALLEDPVIRKMAETQYLYEPMEFNFSAMCNMGARAAKGEALLFLNDDIEAAESSWLEEMLLQLQNSYTGAVGCKLYYPKSKKIQHLGVWNLPGGPVHKLQFLEESQGALLKGKRNVLAVTGACLMVKKSLFDKVGGFPEELSVAYNDVALCMAIYREGFHNVVLTEHYLYHHESLSRGSDLTPEKLDRLKKERNCLYQMFPEFYGKDPYYSPLLSHELGDAGMQPRFFKVIKKEQKSLFTVEEQKNYYPSDNLEVFLEETTGEGYGVVLGENNALFKRYLILQSLEGGKNYRFALQDQYCEETAFWKQEQPNCAMCGFDAGKALVLIKDGNYRIGYLAKSKVSRKTCFAWVRKE